MQITGELIEREKDRADCYRLLSACYCYAIEQLKEEGLKVLIKSISSVSPEVLTFVKNMDEAIKDTETLDLKVDHTALFIGPFKLPSPPYGSCYLEEGRRVLGDTTIEVVRFYRQAGVEMDRETQRDMPDHIAVELEFMYYLISKGIKAWEDGDTDGFLMYQGMQKEFLSRYIASWVVPFTNDMKAAAKTSFYQNLADCTQAFIKSDMEYLMSMHAGEWVRA